MANHDPRNPQLAPSWLPRHQRRRINRQLHRLLRRDVCSVCGSAFKHNSRTTSGLDTQGSVVVAGECCTSWVAVVFGWGLYSDRHYDFLQPRDSKPDIEPTNEQIVDAIEIWQSAIANTDKRLDNTERRGGDVRSTHVSLLDHPWKSDDRDWFERNRSRSHRTRTPFPGEVDEAVAKTPNGCALLVLVWQVEPGARLRSLLYLNTDWLPLPDDEAVGHVLFEIAMGHEAAPPDGEALRALAERYTTRGASL